MLPQLDKRTLVMVQPANGTTDGYARLPVHTWRDGEVDHVQDNVAEEMPVALVYNDEPYVVMMTTPADYEDFALGFSMSEGIISGAEELGVVHVASVKNGIEISLHIPAQSHQALRKRNISGRTGCGLCGAQSIADAIRHPPRVPAGIAISDIALHKAFDALHHQQSINTATGATHAAAWANANGKLIAVREDVGRHNALDKLIGALMHAHQDLSSGFLLITSRASYEMVLKPATVGISFIAAISAPTAFAVRMAEQAGLTLVGFARDNSHVIYTGANRLFSRPLAEPSLAQKSSHA